MRVQRRVLLIVTVIVSEHIISSSAENPDLRIIGGNTTAIENAPWQVSIQIFSHQCGGSIIGSNVVVTSATCAVAIIPGLNTVMAGSANLSDPGVVMDIEEVIINENYAESDIDYDVAVLKLTENLTFSDKIKAIGLADENATEPAIGTKVTVTGWGYIESDFNRTVEIPDLLSTVNIEIWDRDNCSLQYNTYVTERMICAGLSQGGVGSCQWDFGGPLVLDEVLVGISSFGDTCFGPERPSVYTLVSSVREWIRNNTGI